MLIEAPMQVPRVYLKPTIHLNPPMLLQRQEPPIGRLALVQRRDDLSWSNPNRPPPYPTLKASGWKTTHLQGVFIVSRND